MAAAIIYCQQGYNAPKWKRWDCHFDIKIFS
jgi:hypothetical protein